MFRYSIVFAALLSAQAALSASATLSPGVIVDLEVGAAFAIDREGRTQRVSLASGAIGWISGEQSFPLALADGRLVALGATSVAGSATLLVIDPANGKLVDRVSIDLPESVSASFFPNPNQRFTATVLDTPEGVRVFWRHEQRALRGAAIEELDQNGELSINPTTVHIGAFDLVIDNRRYYAVPVLGTLAEPNMRPLALADAERLPEQAGVQYRAADNNDVMTSQATPDDIFGSIYRWSVFDRQGKRIGGYRSPYAFAPFVVNADTLLIREQPFEYRNALGESQSRLARIACIELSTGRERWAFNVLDQQYRGPMPP